MELRSIKFKAKKVSNKEWVFGDLLHRITDTCIAVKDMDDIIYYPVDPSTVCRFTGLKDKDGKEIWEHDVVKSRLDSLYEVVWNNDLAIFTLRSSSYISENSLGSLNDSIVLSVVGSKFDKEVEV